MKNKIISFSLISFVVITILMSIAAALEITSKQQESVSGFMMLSVYAQIPWSFFPQFHFLSEHVSNFFFELIENTLTSYVVEILITGFCWLINGAFIGLLVKFLTPKE